MNLFINFINSLPDGGKIDVRCTLVFGMFGQFGVPASGDSLR
jgi:hypothetical protein